jgi:hypothetical protein
MQAVLDQLARLTVELTYQARTLEPSGWWLLGVGVAALFLFLVRPPR